VGRREVEEVEVEDNVSGSISAAAAIAEEADIRQPLGLTTACAPSSSTRKKMPLDARYFRGCHDELEAAGR
jgi:hypothetical protein